MEYSIGDWVKLKTLNEIKESIREIEQHNEFASLKTATMKILVTKFQYQTMIPMTPFGYIQIG